MEHAHNAVGVAPRVLEALVGAVKAGVFIVLRGVGARHADAGNARFQSGVDFGDFLARLFERAVHLLARFHGKQDDERQEGKHDERQPDVDGRQHHERADEHNRGKEQVLRPVMRQLGHVEQVVDQPRHHRARLVLVVKRKGQLLQPAEHIPPHIPLHPHADDMAPVLDDIVQQRLESVDAQQHARPDEQQPQILRRHILVDDVLGDDGIKQIAQRHNKGAEHIDEKQFSVRLIIADEFSDHNG